MKQLNIKYIALSQKGEKHMVNEDRIYVDNTIISEGHYEGQIDKAITAVVCDGVGGECGGDRAAQIVVEQFKNTPIDAKDMSQFFSTFKDINEGIKEYQKQRIEHSNCATTIAGIILDGNELVMFNAGDTRIYVMRNDKLIQLSVDHTMAMDFLRWKRVNDIERVSKRLKNTLTSYLGGPTDEFAPHVVKNKYYYKEGDAFLICTDGLYKSVSEENIKNVLVSNAGIKSKGKKLMQMATQCGINDDLSFIIIVPNIE